MINNLHCPRTGITHERADNDKPLCDPRGYRFDIYVDAGLPVNCAACRHAKHSNHQETA